MLDLLRNFAGPGATIIAASVAGTIAVIFSKAQRDIAFQQKEIAKEKLRLDLFDKRYKIYANLFEYYNAILSWSGTDEDQAISRRFFLSTKEANFLFGSEVQTILKEILDAGMKVKGFKENKKEYKHDQEFFMKEFNQTNNILTTQFDELLTELTKVCQPYIGFQNSGILSPFPLS